MQQLDDTKNYPGAADKNIIPSSIEGNWDAAILMPLDS